MTVGTLLGKPTARIRSRAAVALVLATTSGVVGLAFAISGGDKAAAGARFSVSSQPARPAAAGRTVRASAPASDSGPTTTIGPRRTTVATAGPAPAPTRRTPTTLARPAATVVTQPNAATPSPAVSVLFGAATDGGPADLSSLNTFEAHAGKKVSLYGYYQSFFYDQNFNAAAASALHARGAMPMITWEPWNPSAGSVDQAEYSLASIASGAHDAYLTRWASQVKAWGQPLWLRFAHEMNGDWYPWAEGVNGNAAGSYVAAWRHVHDVFVQAGATNVRWVWTPNVLIPGRASYASLYPGDAFVDWIGLDGYNWGTSASWASWQSPADVFGGSLAQLRSVSRRPIVIGETASAELGGDKAAWIQNFFSLMSGSPDIQAFVWFNFRKEADWRIESSPAAQAAFSAGVADPRYRAG